MASYSRVNETYASATPAESRVAYVKKLPSEAVGFLYPEAPLLAPGQSVFALVMEDGTPLVLADSHEAAMADAESYQLETVSLH